MLGPSHARAPGPSPGPAPGTVWPTALAVAAGGAVGGSARYGVDRLIPVEAAGFPVATFAVNVVGAFLLGALLARTVRRRGTGRSPAAGLLPFAATGVLGAFPTFSTFVVEAAELAVAGDAPLAAAYVTGSVATGLTAAYLGVRIGGGRR